MAGQGLPNDLDFTLKKAAPRGIRQFRTSLAPIGGVPSTGITDFLRYDVQTGRKGQYIDTTSSYLQLRVRAAGTVGGTGDITLDGSAYALFQRLTILSGGAVLEDIVEYGNMVQLYMDNGMGTDKRQSDGNMLLGTASTTGGIIRNGIVIPAGTSYNFCIPIVSGILGSQGSTKYLPVGAILSDLRMEIQLANAANAVINTSATPAAWSITEANLMLSVIELDSEVQNMIDAATGGKYYISSESYKWYSNTIASGSTQDSVLIPARFASVKGLIGSFRPVSNQSNYLAATISARTNPFFHASNMCSVQFAIGSALYPNSPIRSSQEVYAEVVKYFHSMGNLYASSSINQSSFNIAADAADNASAASNATVATYYTSIGTGCFAINLDNVANRSDVMSSGLNTLTSNIILNMTYGTTPNEANRLDVYAHIDMVLAIENGIFSVIV